MIQVRLSKIDFDFYEYGMNRVARFHAKPEADFRRGWRRCRRMIRRGDQCGSSTDLSVSTG